MKKTVMFCLVLSTVLLAACQQTKKATAQSSKAAESSIAVTKESSSKASTTSSTTSSTDTSSSTATETTTVSNLLWSAYKSNQLASLMASWGQTMGQSYQAYGPGNNINLYGLQLPDGVLNHMNGWQATVANTPISLTWSENGEVPSGYGLVAVYSDAQTQSGQKTRHVYFFTIEGGTPKVLVTSQNQGNPNNYLELRETDNQELKNGFSQIVTGQ